MNGFGAFPTPLSSYLIIGTDRWVSGVGVVRFLKYAPAPCVRPMTDDYPQLDSLDQLWPTWLELKEPIEREYAATMGPVRKARTQQLADLERDYAAKVQQVKADLYQAQRRFKDAQYALKRWKDSTARVVEQDYRNVQVQASATRKRKLAPLQTWFDRERKRLLPPAEGQA